MDFLNVLPMVVADSSDIAALFGSLIGLVIALIPCLLMLVAMWKLFAKMGEPGWYAIVPILNTWKLFEHAMGNGLLMLTMLIPGVNAVMSFICLWKLFQGFGKSTGFCVLGMFFSPIALLICAFDSSTFINQR